MKLELVQPTLRREWELRRGGQVAARMRLPLIRRGASVELGMRELEISRVRGLRSEHAVRDTATGEELMHQRGGKVELGGRSAEWKRLGRKEGHGFVGPDGELFVRVKIASGLLHTNGEAEAGDVVAEQDALVLALLGSYLLIRKAEDEASAAGAATTAAASTS
jgi:hypothetical protein